MYLQFFHPENDGSLPFAGFSAPWPLGTGIFPHLGNDNRRIFRQFFRI